MAEATRTEPVVPVITLGLTEREAVWLKAVVSAVDGDGSENRIDLDIWNALHGVDVKSQDQPENGCLSNYSVVIPRFGLAGTH